MTSITVRNLDASITAGLHLRAARHGWPMEQEVRQILKNALVPDIDFPSEAGFAERVSQRFKGLGGDELAMPARVTGRNLTEFSKP